MDKKYTNFLETAGFRSHDNGLSEIDCNGYKITVDLDKKVVDYGKKIICNNGDIAQLISDKNYIVLECVTRLLEKGYEPNTIMLDGSDDNPDIMIGAICIYCEDNKSYKEKAVDFNRGNYSILYTSQAESSFITFNNVVVFEDERYRHGFFEGDVPAFVVSPSEKI